LSKEGYPRKMKKKMSEKGKQGILEEVFKEVKRIEKKMEEGRKEKKKESEELKKTKKEEIEKGKIAVIRIRGMIGIRKDIRDTLDMLKLHKKHFCVIFEKTPSNIGMIKKTKDYVTWGEIREDVLKELLSKRAEKNPKDLERTKKFFRLNSPKKGFERKGIKVSFGKGGALGYRGEKINDLLKRMM